MKILHTFTLQSPDNAFGGPIRVALNLGHELIKRSEAVALLGGARGYSKVPEQIEGIPAHLFPVRQIHPKLGFSGMLSVKLWSWAWRHVRDFDLVHIHLARDLITLPVAVICQIRKVPYVVQGHGMIDPTARKSGQLLDLLLVKRVLKNSHKNLFLTEQERLDYSTVAGRQLGNLEFLPNGVPMQTADLAQQRTQVSYISRLQARKRPVLFVQMAAQLISAGLDLNFVIAGADEGELNNVNQEIQERNLADSISYVGPINHEQVLNLLARTQVLVLPSINEPFPMIILEAIASSVPVVITDTCGLADYITKGNAGIVTDGSVDELAKATEHILKNINQFSISAKSLAVAEFSMSKIGDTLTAIYNQTLELNARD